MKERETTERAPSAFINSLCCGEMQWKIRAQLLLSMSFLFQNTNSTLFFFNGKLFLLYHKHIHDWATSFFLIMTNTLLNWRDLLCYSIFCHWHLLWNFSNMPSIFLWLDLHLLNFSFFDSVSLLLISRTFSCNARFCAVG